MSLTIYTGYKIKEINMIEMKEFIEELRIRLMPVFEKEYQNIFRNLLVTTIDDITILDSKNNKEEMERYFLNLYKNSYNKCWILNDFAKQENNVSIEKALEEFNMSYFGNISTIVSHIIEQKVFYSQTTDKASAFDFQNEICFFPIKDKTLFIVYGNTFCSILDKIIHSRKKSDIEFRNKFQLEFYGYWNNSDKPSNISYKKWEERETDWIKVLGADCIPSNHGICSEIININTFFDKMSLSDKKKWLKDIDCAKNRAKKNAFADFKKVWISKHMEKDNSYSEIYDLSIKFSELIEKGELNDELVEYNKKYLTLLPEITIDTLKMKIIEFAKNYKNKLF